MFTPLLTVPEAAAALHLTEITVRRATLDGRIPVVRLGRVVRITPATLERIAAEGLPSRPRTDAELAMGKA